MKPTLKKLIGLREQSKAGFAAIRGVNDRIFEIREQMQRDKMHALRHVAHLGSGPFRVALERAISSRRPEDALPLIDAELASAKSSNWRMTLNALRTPLEDLATAAVAIAELETEVKRMSEENRPIGHVFENCKKFALEKGLITHHEVNKWL
ncbi:MAG: hypothetical protein H6905_06840 [Hyphomicrobiales bacterium]|nr:hypothetical protein [Hyphomicrobiales bacterium]